MQYRMTFQIGLEVATWWVARWSPNRFRPDMSMFPIYVSDLCFRAYLPQISHPSSRHQVPRATMVDLGQHTPLLYGGIA